MGAGLCAVCCVVPMLVVFGVVSVAALVTVGLAAAAIVGLLLLAWAVAANRLGSPRPWIGRVLGGAGAAVAAVSFLLDGNRPGIVVGVALLAGGALLVLAAVRTSSPRLATRDC